MRKFPIHKRKILAQVFLIFMALFLWLSALSFALFQVNFSMASEFTLKNIEDFQYWMVENITGSDRFNASEFYYFNSDRNYTLMIEEINKSIDSNTRNLRVSGLFGIICGVISGVFYLSCWNENERKKEKTNHTNFHKESHHYLYLIC